MKKKKQKRVRSTSIGGQAVLEGVMMRGRTAVATAVRDQDGVIRTESYRVTPTDKKPLVFRIPVLRGAINFFASLVTGTKILMRSAEVYGESEPTKFEKWLSKKCKIDVMSVIMTLSLILGLGLALGLFVFLPQLLYEVAIRPLFLKWFNIESIWVQTISEGILRILIFIGYILLTSLLKDIRRTYGYHGAEHKTISCYESGKELTVENVRGCTRVHDRCGTTFMFFVMIVSIIVVAVVRSLIEPVLPTVGTKGFTLNKLWQFLIRLCCIPVTAGLSYELLKALAKTKSPLVYPLKAPGLLLQRLTTKEPDDSMIEVAITAFTTVLKMDEDPSIPSVRFVTARKYGELRAELAEKLEKADAYEEADLDFMFASAMKTGRDGVKNTDPEKQLSPAIVEKVTAYVNARAAGKPLSYVLGTTDFYGYELKSDERALIPRPETELLTEKALAELKPGDKALDLCTGSGCIACVLAKKGGAVVTASDLSEEALSLAKENFALLSVPVTAVKSDLFENIEGKFRVIVSNPPYIPQKDIATLQKEVRDFEPITALDGGEDGLDFYRRIAAEAPAYLEDGGVLLLEIGIGQAEAVRELLKGAFDVTVYPDYAGIDRMVKAVKR